MENLSRQLNNDRGSIMLVTLLILSLMTILGLSASKTTVFELQISTNQMISRQNFYGAEAAMAEGMQILQNEADLENNAPPWVQVLPGASPTSEPGELAVADVYNDATWGDANSQESGAIATARVMGNYRGRAPKGSQRMGSSTVYRYDIYGRNQLNNDMAIVKMEYRKAY